MTKKLEPLPAIQLLTVTNARVCSLSSEHIQTAYFPVIRDMINLPLCTSLNITDQQK